MEKQIMYRPLFEQIMSIIFSSYLGQTVSFALKNENKFKVFVEKVNSVSLVNSVSNGISLVIKTGYSGTIKKI